MCGLGSPSWKPPRGSAGSAGPTEGLSESLDIVLHAGPGQTVPLQLGEWAAPQTALGGSRPPEGARKACGGGQRGPVGSEPPTQPGPWVALLPTCPLSRARHRLVHWVHGPGAVGSAKGHSRGRRSQAESPVRGLLGQKNREAGRWAPSQAELGWASGPPGGPHPFLPSGQGVSGGRKFPRRGGG